MSGPGHARAWCASLGTDIDALVAMYRSEGFASEQGMVEDPMEDTLTTEAQLRAAYGPFSDGANGTYTFTATGWLGGRADHGLIRWDVRIEGAATFRGIPADGRTLQGTGSTFQRLGADGRIAFESTFWEDTAILAQLGVPVGRPRP